MKQLKSLEQHNAERYALYEIMHRKNYNGIACPKCAEETFDALPNAICTSEPPQVRIRCKCGFDGYRAA